MAERFYLNSPLAPGLVDVDGPEAHHLATVSRLRPGDAVCLFNGDGHEYSARLVSVSKRAVTVEILRRESPPRRAAVFLGGCRTSSERRPTQFLVEKLTELGGSRFVPLACARSVIEPRPGKLEKFERYVIEASKQCGRNVMMQIATLENWGDYCQRGNPGEVRLLAHPAKESPPATKLEPPAATSTIRLAVGPEGGFTDEEVQLAESAGWQVDQPGTANLADRDGGADAGIPDSLPDRIANWLSNVAIKGQ